MLFTLNEAFIQDVVIKFIDLCCPPFCYEKSQENL